MKWIKLKTKLKKDKKKKNPKDKTITKINRNGDFMQAEEINSKTKRFSKVRLDKKEISDLKKQGYFKKR